MPFSARWERSRNRFGDSFSALKGVFANPELRRVQLAYAGSSMGNFAYGVAIAVYAYQHGGADGGRRRHCRSGR